MHIDEDILPLLSLSDEERIAEIQKGNWIGYSRAKEIIQSLSDLVKIPRSYRSESALLIGNSGNGKTTILRQFVDNFQPFTDPEDDGVKIPVLYIQAPHIPDERRFYNNILEATFSVRKKYERLDQKQLYVKNILRQIKLKVLVIDEIHNLLAGSNRKHEEFLNLLRELTNELQINLVCAGINTAFNAVSSDTQLKSRFTPYLLPKWKYDDPETFRLLGSLEKRLPLKNPSNLMEPGFVEKVIEITEGTIGEIIKLIRSCSIYAIKSGEEKIRIKSIEKSGYISPSQHRKLQKLALQDQFL